MDVHRLARPSFAIACALVLASCSQGSAQSAATTSAAVPHGYVEGAEEVADAQVGLAFAELGSQELSILDLATEARASTSLEVSARTLIEDGRFVYVGDGDRSIEIVDTGVWTVDHVDHVHYYRAPVASLGVLELDAPVVSVVGQGPHTAIGTQDGTVTIIDRKGLEEGRLTVVGELETDAVMPFAVPFQGDLLLATTSGIVTVDPQGGRTGEGDASCANPQGWAILRSGVAIGCDDGVLLVKRPSGTQVTLTLPYPAVAARATAFAYRPRSNEAAATAGNEGVWSIDANHERLAYVPAGQTDVIAAASPADERHVVSVHDDGTVRLAGLADGATAAEAALLSPGATSPVLVDDTRAYVAAVESRQVFELDYGDALRVARTFDLEVRPDLIVEVGR